MITLVRSYDSHAQARAAVNAIEKLGVPASDISLIANGTLGTTPETDDVAETATGAGIGGVVGGGAGLLAGLGMLAIPGLGPVIGVGWLAATAMGAAAGVVTGGIVGALVNAGADQEEAEIYSESIRRGATMVTARLPAQDVSRIDKVLESYGPIDPAHRGEEYRRQGWAGFDADAQPSPRAETEAERERRDWRDQGMGKQV